MAGTGAADRVSALPRLARWLGLAGLVPQGVLAAVVIGGPREVAPVAAGLALAYAALILSFIGGAWWGLATRAGERAPRWIWLAAVAPSLIAFAALASAAIVGTPGPGLLITATALVAALWIDFSLVALGLCPPGWPRLRTPLSLGLGALCLLIAAVAP